MRNIILIYENQIIEFIFRVVFMEVKKLLWPDISLFISEILKLCGHQLKYSTDRYHVKEFDIYQPQQWLKLICL